MMTSNEIRTRFLEFFESKGHKIVPSAPMVIKNDPTLMFTNAGMNQFKKIFLGNAKPDSVRVADSQKCLRVSGKHNDLEEVGHDTYHHTMFEMLGNWSFGDYFKKGAIEYAWELLVDTFKIDKSCLYATVFEGSKEDNIDGDNEAREIWQSFLPTDRVLDGSKKDNFWEMGETGPCGPCSEIHIDLRSDEEKKNVPGYELVNKDHPLVIEIWNLVFIQFNRKANGQLEHLPAKHIDTGMGFERLCMVLQGKKSNYDTDVFQPIIKHIEKLTNIDYGADHKTDIAMRVIADHLRTVAFSIADGQLPSNNKAGYVIRRILRRAIRYGYTFLNMSQPFMYKLIPSLLEVMGEAYNELSDQKDIIVKVLKEEEQSFLNTLETGIKLLDSIISKTKQEGYDIIDGKVAFELYDTFGFPLDLTELIAKENGLIVNRKEFDEAMQEQKNRSRQASSVEAGDWVEILADEEEEFIGYDYTETHLKITRYRKVTEKGKDLYHLVFNITPFYAESGGQVGDTGYIENQEQRISILDTKKENNLSIHIAKELPKDIASSFTAVVNSKKRKTTECNHSATHLLHFALRQVLGGHVEQKGSLVETDRLRFDFAHFEKMNEEQIIEVEDIVNNLIRKNIALDEKRAMPFDEAKNIGAMALFGEKYGDLVRVIRFGDSVELCGGTHVNATGEIGMFKIVSESAIAAGIRRIEAITSEKAYLFFRDEHQALKEIRALLKNPNNISGSIDSLLRENAELKKQLEAFQKEKASVLKTELKNRAESLNGVNVIAKKVDIESAAMLKDLSFQLKGEMENMVLILGAEINGKPLLSVMLSDELVKEYSWHAGKVVKEAAKAIKGGGGGQPFYATAGGKDTSGIEAAIKKAKEILSQPK